MCTGEQSHFGSASAAQHGVLLGCDLEPHATASELEGILERLLLLRLQLRRGAAYQVPDLLRVGEVQSPAKRRFRIGFQKMHMPGVPQEETHVNAVRRGLAAVAEAVLRVHAPRWCIQRRIASVAELPALPLPRFVLSLSAHKANGWRKHCGKPPCTIAWANLATLAQFRT